MVYNNYHYNVFTIFVTYFISLAANEIITLP
jgi:hypothetical protein